LSLGGTIFAATYDRLIAKAEKAGLADRRERLLADLTGRVLEIGGGTGANLGYYGDSVTELTVVEPEEAMARRLERKARDDGYEVELVRAPAEELPFEDGQFDVAVSTLVLRTVHDQPRALAEVRRVLKPGGRLLFIEHVRSEKPKVARWQDRLNGVNRVIAWGCNCNRATLDAIRDAGFTVTEVEHGELAKAPPFVRPLIVGTAVTNGG
jgi:ubiquinone/menaquinone biosynthesis C-methylase UbiE